MLDIKWIFENKDDFDTLLHKRRMKLNVDELIELYGARNNLNVMIQQFNTVKNQKTKKLSLLSPGSDEFEDIKRDVVHINEKLNELSARKETNEQFNEIMYNIPNRLHDSVPYGVDESMNQFIRDFKTAPELKLKKVKEHFDLGKELGMMDFTNSARISGSRFVTLKGDLAKLERALINFMMDRHTNEFGFQEISPPILVKEESMYNTGHLPKFDTDSYAVDDGKLRLISTGEIPLINMVADTILKREELPLRYVSYTPCFRSEAGSAGKDTKGMIRNHQFGKVELASVTTPDESYKEQEYLLNVAEEILKQLDLHYRVMLLSSGDTGFSAAKTYDIEVWLPGQKCYREISSISNCTDFQARRMKARYRELNSKNSQLVHTLNGSGLPIGRTIVAILENYQNEDGSINIPSVLKSYMHGAKKIEKQSI